MELTINKILNMASSLPEHSSYDYNQHTGIGGKSLISPANQSLKTIPLSIKLHYSNCNPAEALSLIEYYAQNNLEIDWFQYGEYLGRYVITSIDKVIRHKMKDIIFYAEVDIELLESPVEEEDFNPTDTDALNEAEAVKPSLVKKIKQTSAQIVKDSVFTALSTVSINNISDIGNLVTDNLKQGIINNVEQSGISGIYDYASDAVQKVDLFNDLTTEEKRLIMNTISDIPSAMIDAAID